MRDQLGLSAGSVLPAHAQTWRFSRGTGPSGREWIPRTRVELVVDLTAMVASDAVAGRVGETLGDSLWIVATT